MSTLPHLWKIARFADTFGFKGGSQPPKSQFLSEPREGYVRLLQIRDFESDNKAIYIRDQKKWPKCSENDIMIGRYGASVGKVLGGKSGAYNVALVRLIFDPQEVDSNWARYLCKSRYFQEPLKQISRSAQNGFNKEDLADIEFPFPPQNEQRTIAAHLDNLIDHSKSAREELGRIPRLIERYKEAVLAAAYRGNLTGHDAEKWPIMTLGDLIAKIDAGKNMRCEERPPLHSERGIVKVSSVTWGTFDPLASKTPALNASLDPKSLIKSGDFLISRANTLELVGACVIVGPLTSNNLYLSDKILRIRFNQPVEEWVLHFLRSINGRTQIEHLATGNQVSMRNISQSAIRAIRIPMPPENVRKSILDYVRKYLGAASVTLEQVARATNLLDRLDEATIAKAFQGELAPAVQACSDQI